MAGNTVSCDHLGGVVGSKGTEFGQEPVYDCKHPMHKEVQEVECVLCEHFYQQHSQSESGCRHPHGVIVDRYNRSAGLSDLYYGASAFLHLGGPSVKKLDLTKLARRGVLLMSVNNCPASLPTGMRPHIWLHTDPTGKFHDSIWRDPSVLKIVPVREWKSRWANNAKGIKKGIRYRVDGELVPLGKVARDMPGVLAFHRTTTFDPEKFLWEPEFDRGNDEKSSTGMKDGKKVGEANGWPHTINTMFAALRMAFYLGIRDLYLVGADFTMRPGQEYGFNQGKSAGGCRSNNSAYADMNQMFDGLVKEFQEAEFNVYNCNPDSRLWSFPTVPFDEAIERVTGSFEQDLDAKGWYDD